MIQSPVMLAATLAAFVAMAPASAQYYGEPALRYGNTSGHIFDGRDDHRDFPTDGLFPGNFAANPIDATIGGVSGFLDSNPRRSATPYPSQTYFGFVRDRIDCQDDRFHDASNIRKCRRGP